MRSYVLHILNKEDVRPYETPFKLNGAFASLDNLRSPSGDRLARFDCAISFKPSFLLPGAIRTGGQIQFP